MMTSLSRHFNPIVLINAANYGIETLSGLKEDF